jgi:hypothetical protein
MSGLSLNSGLRFRASTANPVGVRDTGTVDYGAFSPGSTQAVQSRSDSLTDGAPPTLAIWTGGICLVALCLIRYSLPK